MKEETTVDKCNKEENQVKQTNSGSEKRRSKDGVNRELLPVKVLYFMCCGGKCDCPILISELLAY